MLALVGTTMKAWRAVDEIVGAPCGYCRRPFSEGDLYFRIADRFFPWARRLVCADCVWKGSAPCP